MNKTIIININGIVFHIEEDAYEVLRSYMTEVKRHFAYSADSEEIVSDIENRIAEMFLERLDQEKKQVIVLQDVQQVTAQMGSVNDFEPDGDDAAFITDDYKIGKKLYRDTDDRIIGGVCSGIGHYFDVEPKWVRIVAIIIIFLGGSGLLIYVILWLAMPKAKTRADKMAMKGEQPNLMNFKKNFDEEVEALQDSVKNARRQAGPPANDLENFLRELFRYVGAFLEGAFRVIVKVLGALIICFCVVAFLALFVGLFGLMGWSSTELDFPPFSAINPEYKSPLYFAVFLVGIIPVTALILFAVRVLFNRTIITRTGSFVMLILWLVGLCMAAFYGTKLGAEFKEEASFSEVIDLKSAPVYYLKLNDAKFLTSADSAEYNINSGILGRRIIINNGDDHFEHSSRMRLTIERSDVATPVLVQTFTSQGPDFETGLASAQRIKYHFIQTDSVLQLDRRVSLAKGELWRGQDVRLTLRIPQNTRLMIDPDLDWYINDLNVWECRAKGSSDRLSIPFKMTIEGLQCDTIVSQSGLIR